MGLVVLLVALLGACAVIGAEERPAPGGIYREAVVGQPLSLNPLLHPVDPVARDVGRLLYAGLVRVVDGGTLAPDLAREWAIAGDGLTYTFRLQPLARWHDGQAVSSADVLATIALLQSPSYQGPAELAAAWRGVRLEAPDPQMVVFRLDEPSSLFLHACSIPILPRHLFGADGKADLLRHPNSFAPVGAGPFRLHSVDEEGIRLVRHESYAGRRPMLEEVHLRFYPDRAAAEQALGAGAVDGLAGISPPRLNSLDHADMLSTREAPLDGFQTMLLLNQDNPVLADQSVRRAIALGLSRRALVDSGIVGHAVPAYVPVPRYSSAYSLALEVDGDVARATRLLEEAGWLGSPIRVRNGRELRVELSAVAESRQVALAEALAGQLGALGFRATVQPVDFLDLFRERLMPRRYDAALIDVWPGGSDPDLYLMWHSSQRERGLNFAGYGSEAMDRVLSRSRTEVDPSRRLEVTAEFQRIWAEDVPSVVLASPLLVYTISSQILGVRLGTVPEPSARFQHIAEWYVRTQRVPTIPGLGGLGS